LKTKSFFQKNSQITTNNIFQILKIPSQRMASLSALKTRYRPFICPLDLILSHIPEGTSLYDIGCGTGALPYLALKLRSAKIAHGYDISPEAVKASQVFQLQPPQFKIDYLKPEQTPPDLSGYDTVTMIDVLHHIPFKQQDNFLRAIVTKMDSGSRLIIKDIEASKTLGAWMNQLHDLLLSKEWVHQRRSKDIVRLLQATGIKVDKPIFRWTLWYPHFLLVAYIP
jgi:2-polyprenyl-3-methyl-5-hydroxy-6-metoxy-1,4-benzoquinol methylase